ncbi:MAG: hypothetical protein COW19_07460 [Zetaproteobacteria bacterium CG12_big_fil_rev_8_21_14_0_65_55_1124]|nr:MAG: hypothetical protein COT53_02165 [Zetaproteobacteria bacterium CG08_land_8_20_14_0_20_55_17]PIW42570.1 MAG: hypothetical protein COW19_07460 [Zetaproteobacteria bacterium CG12_big_fil_rev_8_21_14_0_65_55_1124]PIY53213.1 MAG: hypothetical protein COZ01_04760 [Zetaproteobacteria bacterium CG_4_10_14_0_8_um_filter_55_43]PIZ38511.1 MAG: hypothetical protein COY36_05965 [Zetaproteobacteria bacterium CG_4_10_14_0_2_um_filter_55_20]PJB82671.1 MAG: hypothetical protein CO089_00875 [Zetaproteoba
MISVIKRSLAAQIATILTTSLLAGAAAFALIFPQPAAITAGLSTLLLILLALWFLLRHLIIQPILELQKLARKIGSDEDRTSIKLSNRRDEIGSLSRTLLATEKEVKRQQQELTSLAGKMDKERRHDPLTTLHNRRHLYMEGPKQFSMAQRLGYEISVMMIDLDHFKHINDTYGHPAGDKVLIEVAKTLLKHSRSYDLLIRFGGEEFTLLMLNCNQGQSLQIAQRIREDIESMKIYYEDTGHIPVTCSIGVSSGKNLEMGQMIQAADEAVYKAKSAGRNCVHHAG